MRLTDLPIERPVATIMLLVSLMVLGGVALVRLPLDYMPLVKEPEVDIEAPYPGSHPLETLRDVAMPIEEEVATIPGVKEIETRADSGRARVEVQFDWDESVDLKRMEVREAVERARASLPEGIGFIRVKGQIAGPADGAMLQGRISARRDLSESWELLDRRIKRPIERIKGVASVSLYGVEPQQVRVDLDLDALESHGIRAGDVLARINAANFDLDLGSVRGDVIRYDVRALGRFRRLDEIRDLPLTRGVGGGLRVRDVADVSMREPVLDYGRHLDRRFAIGIDVSKEPTANTVETVDRIMERIDEIRGDPALAGIKLLVWNNAGEEIRGSLRGLRDAGIFGGLLAVAVLFFFLRRVRTTLIVAVAIPFSLVVTCGAMYLLGSQFDVLTLLGLMLGVGMLVDNAVVVMENIHRLQGEGMEAREAAKAGVRGVAMAVIASTATTVIVWSWLFTAERSQLTIMMGATALTICLAVSASLLISLTFIPLAAARFVPKRDVRPGFVLGRMVPAYRGLLAWTLRHRLLALGGLVGLAGSAALPFLRLEKSGEPEMQQRSVQINYRVHDPSTKEVLEKYVEKVEGWLDERKEELGYESMYSWFSERMGVMTRLYVPRESATKRRIHALRRKLEEELPVVAGVKLEVGDREWWRHGSAQGRRMVSVEIHGEEPEYLEELAASAESLLRGIPGVVEVFGPSLKGQKEARILVDPDRAHAFGVSPRGVADTVAFALRGRRLRRFQGRNGEIEMLVGLPDDVKEAGLSVLNSVRIPVEAPPRGGGGGGGARGATIPLGSVAEVTVARMPPTIRRTDRRTTSRLSVQFDEDEVTTEEAQARVRERMAGFALPEGYSWDFGTWGRRQEEALGTMTEGVALSLVVVLLLMAALFESFLQPLAILITLPLAFFGALWALWLGGYDLDVVGFIGVILLIGIVVNNGIVMVDHVNSLRRRGRDRVEALLEGCGNRLRPVLMTAITTIFGLVPLALAGTTVAGAYIDSLAVAVIGGLATSTLFTLVALPVWYTTVEDAGSLLRRLLPRRVQAGRARLRLPRRGVLE